VFLEKASLPSSGGATEETEGALDDMRKYPLADAHVKLGQVTLGQPLLRIEHTLGVGQPNSGHSAGAWSSGEWTPPRLL
jgi:hypothetical protein